MAKKGGQSEIGSVSVGVTADTTKLKQGLNDAQQATRRFADETQKETRRASGAYATLQGGARGIRSAIGLLRTPLTAVASIGAVATIIKSVEDRLAGFSRALAELSKSVQSETQAIASANAPLTDLEKARVDLLIKEQQEIGALNKALEEAMRRYSGLSGAVLHGTDTLLNFIDGDFRAVTTRVISEFKKQADELQRRQGQRRGALEESIDKSKRIEDEKRRTALEDERNAIYNRGVETERRLREELMSERERAEARFKEIQKEVDRLEAQGDGQQAQKLADANAKAFERAMAIIIKQQADEYRQLNRELVDDMRSMFQETIREIQPDIRALGPKLDLMGRNANRLYGRIA